MTMTTTKTLRKSGVTNKKSSQKQPNTIALIFKTIFKKKIIKQKKKEEKQSKKIFKQKTD